MSKLGWRIPIVLLAVISSLNACASTSTPKATGKSGGDTVSVSDGEKEYRVRKVSFSNRKGLTVGLANIGNYVCLERGCDSIEQNKKKLAGVINQLKKHHVNMIIFPEFSLTGYFWAGKGRVDSRECWEYMNRGVLNRHLNWLKKEVKSKLDTELKYIVFNSIRENPATASEPGAEKKFLNSTYVIDSTFDCDNLEANEKTHIYDKTFLPGIENVYTTTPRKDFLVVENKSKKIKKLWGNFGLTTCYDMCFSQLYQEYAMVHDVQFVLEIASWRATGSGEYGKRTYDLKCQDCETCEWKPCKVEDQYYYGFQWDLMASARAATNQIWMIAVNAVGHQEMGDYEFWGGSGVWAPSGMKIIEASNEAEELVVVENLPIGRNVDSERDKFDYQTDFDKIYNSVTNCCSGGCSFKNRCGSFTRFD